MRLTFLGTGTSAGVPMIGCRCGVCTSDDPRDQRTRPSVMLSFGDDSAPDGERRLLVDTGQELRLQCVREGVERIDAVLYTHAHADHVYGLDDLRRFSGRMDDPLPLYAEAGTQEALRELFPYVFGEGRNPNGGFVPKLALQTVAAGESFRPLPTVPLSVTPLRLMHGRLPVLGFRFDSPEGSIAYCTDCSEVPEAARARLGGLDVLVLDALKPTKHPTHLSLAEAVAIAADLRAGRTFLTHLAHDLAHAELQERTPAGVEPAYDGLKVGPAPA
ncbi:MBL fold metallo-hydrolase [Phycisphaera mikurensis]|uniref:Putative hydrolase n=1 Tax=Phycisphaera mikurensis (strain NBRC 102666 / KCTC 22515 / FYK2301M01) TaxID=1142394 RepID=I0IDL0_PHYMF|nr:MBL fold metallo-hydrolase [Phycisphaera mikurensis]MBB6441168.1 phosphoribosyl 1,2-cyclic phosphate phosphodiesterase [Phycisphaera mikurensis]BAM03348.1 putative hydrolase [Phycisphaera mikurensis NBRC 102666]